MNMFNVSIKKDGRDYYSLHFDYDKELVEHIKSLEKREYDASTKTWRLNVLNLYNLLLKYRGRKDIFFDFGDAAIKNAFIEKYGKLSKKNEEKAEKINEIEKVRDEALQMKNDLMSRDTIDYDVSRFLKEGVIPFKFQVIGGLFGKLLKRCLYAMEMGSGKTLTTLLACEMNDDIKKVLIICPNSLKYNWANEITKFTNSKFYILNPNKKTDNKYSINEAKYFIGNYEYFRFTKAKGYKEKIESFGLDLIDCLICDESHKLKNTSAIQTKTITKFFKNDVEYLYLLTGTPIPNRIEEIFVQLNMVSPLQFATKKSFYENYCGLVYDPKYGQWVMANESKNFVLNKELDRFMFRVKTKDVIKDLPDIQINKIYLDMTPTQYKKYKETESEFKNLEWGDKSAPITLITKLRQLLSEFKLEHATELISTLNEEGQKTITFDYYKSPLYQLKKIFPTNSEVYSGDIDSSERNDIVNKFQDPSNSLSNLFITMQSGNFGITLTAASKILVLNQSYVPAENDQAYARSLRIGQKNNVSVFILIFTGTIDEVVDEVIKSKRKNITEIVDNETYEDKSVMTDLIKMYMEMYKN